MLQDDTNNTCIYDAVLTTKLMMPNRAGRAVLQWQTDTEDVRSYVSCSDIVIKENPHGPLAHLPPDVSLCNGHPLCNCTIVDSPAFGSVGKLYPALSMQFRTRCLFAHLLRLRYCLI